MIIEITAWFGDETVKYELSKPFGGGGTFHICEYTQGGMYFCGQIVMTSTGWKGYPNSKSGLTGADMLILIEIIESYDDNNSASA